MKYYILILLLHVLQAHSQPVYTRLFSIPAGSEIIATDALDNIYMVKGSEVIKYDDKGELCCSFSDKSYGDITSIDTRDPLRILLFYKPFGVVRLLDNKLAEQSTIDVHTLSVTEPWLVCSSEMQGMWVYDNATSRLYKFNIQLQPVSLSNDLRQDVMHSISPTMMMESDYWLVLLDKEALLVFDKMGNYFKPVPLNSCRFGRLIHDEWICMDLETLRRINLRTGESVEFKLPFYSTGDIVLVTPQRIIHVSGNKSDVYNY